MHGTVTDLVLTVFLAKNGGYLAVVIERKPEQQEVEPHPSLQQEVAALDLVQPLHKEGRTTIATKLMGFFSKCKHY